MLCKISGFTAVTMNNAVFWDVMPCDYCKIPRFGGMYHLHYQGEKNQQIFLRSMLHLLGTANIVPSSMILVTLMVEALGSS
jgi:hypothetical protein